MSTTRREFLSVASASALVAASCKSLGGSRNGELFGISLAQWSFHRALQSGQMANLDFPAIARRDYAIDKVEYVNTFFKEEARDETYLSELRRRCTDSGVNSRKI